ncbi:G protein gamma domain-containing protein [Meloidogyne graminicola]|uniref:G protein gamma domain-containing protein n=1 Tax=Meloidogyne graminicola TaxID=189291 RepID=A0A8T0A2D0_9BILA|nr:G protein gamma domain-containing protein [Meloidogyne graminicola]
MSNTVDVHLFQQASATVDQLKREKNINRICTSKAIDSILSYTREMQKDDYLLNGFPTDKMNPFRQKSSFQCLTL